MKDSKKMARLSFVLSFGLDCDPANRPGKTLAEDIVEVARRGLYTYP